MRAASLGRLLLVLLLLPSAFSHGQGSAVVYYRETVYAWPGTDTCAIGPVYADTPNAVAEFIIAKNNALSSCSPTATCKDPAILLSVTDTSFTLKSACNGAQFVHPIYKVINPKQKPDTCCVGNPVNAGYGAKYQKEVDYPGTTAGELGLIRFYNSASDPQVSSGVGVSWTHNYQRRLSVITGSTSSPVPYDATFARRPDGQVLVFKKVSGIWTPDADAIATLEDILDPSSQVIGTRLTIGGGDEVEVYDLGGKLTTIKNRHGRAQTLTYSDGTGGPNGGFLLNSSGNPTGVVIPKDILIRVTDNAGRTLLLGYDTARRLAKVTEPNGGIYRYQYGTNHNLLTVIYPDTRTRQYVYNEPANTSGANLPRALTGIVDENGIRYATFKYDTQGRAISTEHANGAGSNTLAYTVDGSGNPVSTSVTDPLGTSRTHSFQVVLGAIKQTGVSAPGVGAAAESMTYDSNGNVATRIDFNGNRTNYTYDLGRNLETLRTEGLTAAGATTPQTRTITTQWHASLRLPTAIAEPLRTTSFTYDPDGTVCGAKAGLCSKSTQATTDGNGSQGFSATPAGNPRAWAYTYNSNGSVLTVDGPRTDVSDVTTYSYYADNASCSTANGGHATGCRGQVETITNALSQTTDVTTYNGHGQPLRLVDPNGLVTEITYNWRQQPVTRAVGGEATTYTYDYAGQLTRVTLADGSYLNYDYDDAHRLSEIADNLGNRVVYGLDAMGNRTLEEVRDPSNALAQTRSRVYSNLGRLFQELGASSQTTEYTYDDQGNVLTVEDPLNRVTAHQYDALNRLKQVTDPASGITQYGYDGIDQLVSVTDPRSLATSYTVNGLGNLSQQVSPDTGTTASTHDAAGNLLTQTDAKAQVTTYTYDALNRVTQITFHDASKQVYAYDSGTNGIGRLASITERDPSNQITGQTSYAYDLKGRVTSETRSIAGVNYVTGYSYDSFGRLSGMTYPSGRTVSYTFDSLGRVSGVSTTPSGGSAQTLASSITYQPFGGVKALTFGNGQTYARGYDQDGRIVSYTLGAQTFAIGYDDAGRIEFISETGNPPNTNTYVYDDLDRLTGAITPSTPFAYTYDSVGNRLTRTVGSGTETLTYSLTSNRIATLTPASGPARSFTLDANGSTTDDDLNTYAYDVRGRMVSATSSLSTTTYEVNALGQRVRKTNTSGDRVFHYDQSGHLLAEDTAAGSVLKEYVWLGDLPVSVLDGTGHNYIHADHLNTPRLIADSTGTTVWRNVNTEPFGDSVPDENPSGLGIFELPLRFPGQYADKETNLHYNYFRDYDPSIGRYPQSDPIGIDGGLNTYAYVTGNPLGFSDPNGLQSLGMLVNPIVWGPPLAIAAVWALRNPQAVQAVLNAMSGSDDDPPSNVIPLPTPKPGQGEVCPIPDDGDDLFCKRQQESLTNQRAYLLKLIASKLGSPRMIVAFNAEVEAHNARCPRFPVKRIGPTAIK